jgi:hypothetical protein
MIVVLDWQVIFPLRFVLGLQISVLERKGEILNYKCLQGSILSEKFAWTNCRLTRLLRSKWVTNTFNSINLDIHLAIALYVVWTVWQSVAEIQVKFVSYFAYRFAMLKNWLFRHINCLHRRCTGWWRLRVFSISPFSSCGHWAESCCCNDYIKAGCLRERVQKAATQRRRFQGKLRVGVLLRQYFIG